MFQILKGLAEIINHHKILIRRLEYLIRTIIIVAPRQISGQPYYFDKLRNNFRKVVILEE
jgi:hypothetical protein